MVSLLTQLLLVSSEGIGWMRSVTNSPVVFINIAIIPNCEIPKVMDTHFEFYPF